MISDRFTDATFAYQGGGRGFDLGVLAVLEQWVQALPEGVSTNGAVLRQPDLTLLFELSPELAAERLAGARVPDRFEAQPVEFFRQVADGYAARAAAAPGRFGRIDASASRHQVWQQVTATLVRRGWLSIMVPTPEALK